MTKEEQVKMAYAALLREHDRTGLPEHFQNDLFIHDKRKVEEEGLTSFVWVARTCGTHLYTFEEIRRFSTLLSPGCISDDKVTFFIYHQGNMREVNREDVLREVDLLEPPKHKGIPKPSWGWNFYH